MHASVSHSLRLRIVLILVLFLALQPGGAALAHPSPLFDLALTMDNANNYATIPDNSYVDLGTGATDDFTLETFFYVPDLNNNTPDTLFWKQGSYGLYIIYSTTAADRLIFRLYTGYGAMDYVYIFFDQNLTVGWHHVAISFDNEYTESSDKAAIFLDGSEVVSGTGTDWTPGLLNNANPFSIGGYATTNPAAGWLEEVRISDSLRYSGPYTVPTSSFTDDANTRALWHFNEAWGSTMFYDSSGNGNTLTGMNGAMIGNPNPNPPGTFSKSAPANGATNQPTILSLSWTASANAEGYELCLDDTAGDTCDASWMDVGTSTSTSADLSGSTTYYWQVRAVNHHGYTYATGAWWSFTTSTAAPGAFGKSGPTNGAVDQSLSFSLTWGTSSNATAYWYCLEPGTTCDNWSEAGNVLTVSTGTLLPGTTYAWHVRADNAQGSAFSDGAASAFWTFTTGAAPGAFNKSSPSNGSTGRPLTFNLTWADSPNVSHYWYCLEAGTTCDNWTDAGSSTSVSTGTLLPGTAYAWHVKAVNGMGTTYANGSGTAFWTFTTGALPGIFGKIEPADDSVNQSAWSVLSWEASTNATSYSYCLEPGTTCDNWMPPGNYTGIAVGQLEPSTTYAWHVRAHNGTGTTFADGSASAFWTFTTGPAPTGFNKSGPSNGATGQLLNLSLSWQASSTATGYLYCIDTGGSCDNWTEIGDVTSVQPPGLAPNTTYYWHVRAANNYGYTFSNGSPTAFWSFTTVSGTAQPGPTYTVNLTADSDDGLCAVSHCTLREAINAANDDGVASVIELQPSAVYTVSTFDMDFNGKTGLPAIRSAITINGHGAHIVRNNSLSCSLDGTSANSEFRLLYVDHDSSLTVNDLTLENGCVDGNTDPNGGAIYADRASLTINNSSFLNNLASHSGGAIYLTQSSLTLDGSGFSNNRSGSNGGAVLIGFYGSASITGTSFMANSSKYGGALRADSPTTISSSTFTSNTTAFVGGEASNTFGGAIFSDGNLTITDSMFSNNSAPPHYSSPSSSSPGYGGAIFSEDPLTITGTTFTGNSAYDGGAIITQGSASLTDTTFTNNQADWYGAAIKNEGTLYVTTSTFQTGSAAYGGGIHNEGWLEVSGSTFTGNSASGGGGISNFDTLRLLTSTLFGNTAEYGGALYVDSGGTDVINSTLSGNSAGYRGGALYATTYYAPPGMHSVSLIFSTIANNTASNINNPDGRGGGIYNDNYDGMVGIKNTILAGNNDLNGLSYDCGGAILTLDYNLVQNLTGCTFTPAAHDRTGLNPMLRALALNGGPTKTHALPGNSPAVDAVPSGVNGCGTTTLTDQRGETRPTEGNAAGLTGCDIGAYEAPTPVLQKSTFISVAAHDGWLLESSEASNLAGPVNPGAVYFQVGDDAANRQYRSILSFNTASLPNNIVITKAVLKIKRQQLAGDPFGTLGALKLDIYKPFFGAAATLAPDDFKLLGVPAGVVNSTPLSGNWYKAVLPSSAYQYISRNSTSQLRLRFATDDDNDLAADLLKFFSGNADPGFQPKLIITYFIP